MVMTSGALLAVLEPVRRGGLRKRRAGAWIERAAIRGLPRGAGSHDGHSALAVGAERRDSEIRLARDWDVIVE
jgi:hypothetical protein